MADWPRTSHGTIGLADVIGQIEATILIGLSTVGGAFTEPIVREMARKVERPVIFPLSNPTARSEASPEDLIRWTDGRALVATGSPYPPVQYEGRTIPIAQCNNVFIFPAVGLGVVASGARRVTDGMMLAAARALGEHSPARKDPSGSLLPALRDVRGRGPGDRDGGRPGGPAGRGRAEDEPRGAARPGRGRAVDAGVPADRARRVSRRRNPACASA